MSISILLKIANSAKTLFSRSISFSNLNNADAKLSDGLDASVWDNTAASYLNKLVSEIADSSTALSTEQWNNNAISRSEYLTNNFSTIAQSRTALSISNWTLTRAGYLDSSINSKAPSATALSTVDWTSSKAAYIDASLNSLAPQSTALSTANWTPTKAAYLDATISSITTDSGVWSYPTSRTLTAIPSIIKTVQKGTKTSITVNGDITLSTAVDPDKSFLEITTKPLILEVKTKFFGYLVGTIHESLDIRAELNDTGTKVVYYADVPANYAEGAVEVTITILSNAVLYWSVIEYN